jgi:hypothetical protein
MTTRSILPALALSLTIHAPMAASAQDETQNFTVAFAAFNQYQAGVLNSSAQLDDLAADTHYDTPAIGVVTACSGAFPCTSGETATVRVRGLITGIDTTGFVPDGYEGYPVCIAPGSTTVTWANCAAHQSRVVGFLLTRHATTGRLLVAPGNVPGTRKLAALPSGTCEASQWSFRRGDQCWEESNDVLKVCELDECFGTGWTIVAGNAVCPGGMFENRLERWEHSGAVPGGWRFGEQLFQDLDSDNALDANEPTGWYTHDWGTGTSNIHAGLVVQYDVSSRGLPAFAAGATLKEVNTPANTLAMSGAPQPLHVYACERTSSGGDPGTPGSTVVDEVIVGHPRADATDSSQGDNFREKLEAAWYYCSDNSRFDPTLYGVTGTTGGCKIRFLRSQYALTGTKSAMLRLRDDANPNQSNSHYAITIDGSGSTVYFVPTAPSAIASASLPTCDASIAGEARRITDAQNWLAGCNGTTCTGATDTVRTVDSARYADDADADECDGNADGGVCDWGKPSIVLNLNSSSHGYSAGLPVRNGDFVRVDDVNDECDDVYLVKASGGDDTPTANALAADEIVITDYGDADFDNGGEAGDCTAAEIAGASVERADTTVWCNGSTWEDGFPAISLGGPALDGAVQANGAVAGVEVRDFVLAIVSTINVPHPIGIRLDGAHNDSSGLDGGVQDITISTIRNVGNTSNVGQVLVDLLLRVRDATSVQGTCQDLTLRDISSDFWGMSEGWTVRNVGCKNADIQLFTKHGGGYYQTAALVNPGSASSIRLSGNLEGNNDGPALFIEHGDVDISGMGLCGDVNAGDGGSDRGLCAIIGHTGSTNYPARVLADGVLWRSIGTERNECDVYLHKAHVTQSGGILHLTNRGAGATSDEPLRAKFCSHSGSVIDALNVIDAEIVNLDGGSDHTGSTVYKELSTPTYSGSGRVCPGCIDDGTASSYGRLGLGIRDTAGGLGTGCLQSPWHASVGADVTAVACAAALTSANLHTTRLKAGAPAQHYWVHGISCSHTMANGATTPGGWSGGDTLTLTVKDNNGSSFQNLITGLSVALADWPQFYKRVNRLTRANAGLAIEVTAVPAGATKQLDMGCEFDASPLTTIR